MISSSTAGLFGSQMSESATSGPPSTSVGPVTHHLDSTTPNSIYTPSNNVISNYSLSPPTFHLKYLEDQFEMLMKLLRADSDDRLARHYIHYLERTTSRNPLPLPGYPVTPSSLDPLVLFIFMFLSKRIWRQTTLNVNNLFLNLSVNAIE